MGAMGPRQQHRRAAVATSAAAGPSQPALSSTNTAPRHRRAPSTRPRPPPPPPTCMRSGMKMRSRWRTRVEGMGTLLPCSLYVRCCTSNWGLSASRHAPPCLRQQQQQQQHAVVATGQRGCEGMGSRRSLSNSGSRNVDACTCTCQCVDQTPHPASPPADTIMHHNRHRRQYTTAQHCNTHCSTHSSSSTAAAVQQYSSTAPLTGRTGRRSAPARPP